LPTDPNTPVVLVLMATLNGADWIGAQIRSILASQGVLVRIVISDDGSRDDTLVRAQEAGAGAVSVLPSPGGLGAAQNFLHLVRHADLSGADYVALSDQDDIWKPEKLARAISKLGAADAYSCDVTAVWPDGREKYIRKSYPQKRYDHLFEYGSAGSTFVFPIKSALRLRALLDDMAPRDLARVDSHDWLVYAALRQDGLRWVIDPWSGVQYRQHGGNHRGAWDGVAALRERVERARNGWFRCQVLSIASLIHADCPVVDYMRTPKLSKIGVPLRYFLACRRRPRDGWVLLLLLLLAGIFPRMATRTYVQNETPAKGGRA